MTNFHFVLVVFDKEMQPSPLFEAQAPCRCDVKIPHRRYNSSCRFHMLPFMNAYEHLVEDIHKLDSVSGPVRLTEPTPLPLES